MATAAEARDVLRSLEQQAEKIRKAVEEVTDAGKEVSRTEKQLKDSVKSTEE